MDEAVRRVSRPLQDVLRRHAQLTLAGSLDDGAFIIKLDLARITLSDWTGHDFAWKWRDRLCGQTSERTPLKGLRWSQLVIVRQLTEKIRIAAALFRKFYSYAASLLADIDYELDRRRVEEPSRDPETAPGNNTD